MKIFPVLFCFVINKPLFTHIAGEVFCLVNDLIS